MFKKKKILAPRMLLLLLLLHRRARRTSVQAKQLEQRCACFRQEHGCSCFAWPAAPQLPSNADTLVELPDPDRRGEPAEVRRPALLAPPTRRRAVQRQRAAPTRICRHLGWCFFFCLRHLRTLAAFQGAPRRNFKDFLDLPVFPMVWGAANRCC